MAADADLPYHVGIVVEPHGLVDERRDGPRGAEIDEHARWSREPLIVERHFHVELDDHAHQIGQRGSPNFLDRRQLLFRNSRRAGLRRDDARAHRERCR